MANIISWNTVSIHKNSFLDSWLTSCKEIVEETVFTHLVNLIIRCQTTASLS